MAKFAAGDKVHVDVLGFYGGTTGIVKRPVGVTTEGSQETVYSVDIDVGGMVIVNESSLKRPDEIKGGTYSFGGWQ